MKEKLEKNNIEMKQFIKSLVDRIDKNSENTMYLQ